MVLVVLVALRPARRRAKRQAAEFPSRATLSIAFHHRHHSSQRDKFHQA
jgi:hypothetical protein